MALKINNVAVVDDSKNGQFLSLTVDPSMGAGLPSYLKVPTFSNSAARDANITSPAVGMVVATWNTSLGLAIFEGYDGSKWNSVGGPAAEEALTIAIMNL